MSKDFLRFFIYLNLFQLIIEIKSQEASFKPQKRGAHTATLIEGKLYILGGYSVDNDVIESQFFYLDVSRSFNITVPTWKNLTNVNSVPPPHSRAASVRGGENNNTLVLFGGSAI